MGLPVTTTDFWRERLQRAFATGKELHLVVYDVHPNVWQRIQVTHQEILAHRLTKGMKVLDAGCGYGALWDVMPKEHIEYTGIDLSPDFIGMAKVRNPGVDFRVCDMLSEQMLQFDDNQFDVAICRSVDGMVKDNVGNEVWERMEAALARIAKRLAVFSYEEPAEYFWPSAKVNTPTIVACIPRSGSTMLWRSLMGLPPSPYTPPGCFGSPSNHPVKKLTHFDGSLSGHKAIFVFGDPLASVVSSRNNIYDRGHFLHCGYSGPEKDIFDEDFLGYEKMFDDWTTNTTYPTLCVRYETMHQNVAAISKFVGQPVELPPYRPRSTRLNDSDQVVRAKRTYASLIDKVAKMPDVLVLNGR